MIPTIDWNYDPNEYNYDLALECAELSAAMYGKYRYIPDKDMFYEAGSSSTKAKESVFEQYNIPKKKRKISAESIKRTGSIQ